jgi:hypothetical protein
MGSVETRAGASLAGSFCSALSHSQSARAKAGIIFSIRANFTGHYSPKECQQSAAFDSSVYILTVERRVGTQGVLSRRRVDYFSAWSLNSSMPIMIGHISSTQQPLFNYKSHTRRRASLSPPHIKILNSLTRSERKLMHAFPLSRENKAPKL